MLCYCRRLIAHCIFCLPFSHRLLSVVREKFMKNKLNLIKRMASVDLSALRIKYMEKKDVFHESSIEKKVLKLKLLLKLNS